MKNLLFIGDSLTEWFDWQKRFPGFRVTNLGISGETVEGLLARTDRIIERVARPDFVFIMTGINNIAMEEYGIAGDYRKIIEKLVTAFGGSALVVQSILPVVLPWVEAKEIKRQNNMLKDLAGAFKAEYLDIYGLFVDAKEEPLRGYLLEDGVHLSDEGYSVWADAVEEFLSKEEG